MWHEDSVRKERPDGGNFADRSGPTPAPTVERMLCAGSNLDKARGLRRGDQASAADPADHPAADARAATVVAQLDIEAKELA